MDRPASLTAADARRRAERAAALLCPDPRVQLVYLFGSGARSHQPVVRDVDVGVLADPAFSLDELVRRRADLVAATGVPIDLVSLNDASITAPARFSDFAAAIRNWLAQSAS